MRLAHTAAKPLMASKCISSRERTEVLLLGRIFGSHEATPPLEDATTIPSSSLTRWLRQGIELGICPLCRVAHKSDREYVWHFSEEGFGDEKTMVALAAAHGFCAQHAEMLVRVDHEMKSMLGVATIYAELFSDLARGLAGLQLEGVIGARPCPACAHRDAALLHNARYLLAALNADAGSIVEGFPSSPGLCFPHFELVWAQGGSRRARELILDVQYRTVETVCADLHEFIRKEGVEARHEPRGQEQDAWQRALWLTAGWPAPEESASVPEHGSMLER